MQTLFELILLIVIISVSAIIPTIILILLLRWQRNRHKGKHTKEPVLTLRGKKEVVESGSEIESAPTDEEVPESREIINNIVAVIGSRRYRNKKMMFEKLDGLFAERPKDDFVVVTGDAEGPDEWAVDWAKSRGFEYDIFDVKKGESTFDRNAELAATARGIVAFVPRHLQKSGAKNTISEFRKMGKSLYIIYDQYGNRWDWEWN